MSTPNDPNNPGFQNPGYDPTQSGSQGGQPSGGQPAQNPYGQGQPGQSQPESKYGTAAYHPQGVYNAPIPEPAAYRQLKRMTLVSLGLYVLGQIIALVYIFSDTGRQQIRDQIADQGMGTPSDADISTGIAITVAVLLIILVIAVGVYLLVYFGLRAEKNWARITGIVFAIIGLVFTVGSLAYELAMGTAGGSWVDWVATLPWAAVTIYWLVLAFKSENVEYLDSKQGPL